MCTPQRPGIRYPPLRSITRASPTLPASPLGRIARMRPSSISTAASGCTLGSTQSIRLAWERIVFITAIQAAIRDADIAKVFFDGISPARRGASAGGDNRVGQGGFIGHVLVALAGKPQRVIAKPDRRIFCRITGRAAARQAFDDSVVIGVAEERDRVAHAARNVAYAMRRREKPFVGPAMQDVAAVDDVGA